MLALQPQGPEFRSPASTYKSWLWSLVGSSTAISRTVGLVPHCQHFQDTLPCCLTGKILGLLSPLQQLSAHPLSLYEFCFSGEPWATQQFTKLKWDRRICYFTKANSDSVQGSFTRSVSIILGKLLALNHDWQSKIFVEDKVIKQMQSKDTEKGQWE